MPADPISLGEAAAAVLAGLKPPIGATVAPRPPAPEIPAHAHPLVLAALARFPGASIVNVRALPPTHDQAQPGAGMAAPSA